MTRILLINPNMTRSMTDAMAQVARRTAGDDAEIIALTAERGFPYIASRAEAQVAGALVLEMIAANLEGIDAVVIAAFGDPGLAGARDLFDLPVIGMSEAAILSAAMLGERFSIVTFSPVMKRWYSDCVRATGLGSRFTGLRTPPLHDLDATALTPEMIAALTRLCGQAVHEDGADVVILGGAPLAGLAPKIAADVPGVILDPISAATVQAVALARLGSDYRGRANRPTAKDSVGLAQDLGRIIAQGGP